MRIGFFASIAVLVLVGLSVFFGSWFQIDQGERGVVLRNGAVSGIAEPGLNFKLPIVDDFVRISVQNDVAHYEDLQAYSLDQQPTAMRLSVSYHIPATAVTEAYSEYGSKEGVVSRVLDRRVFEHVKTVFGKYTAVRAIQDRAKLNAEVDSAIKESILHIKGVPLVVDSVQIENIDFSDAYEQSIEARMLAEVEVQKLRQNAEREKVQAQITVTQAKAKADSTIATATADADAIRLRGDAEAQAIKAKSAALQTSPSLIELTKAEKWNGVLPTHVLPNGTVPFLDVAK